MSLFKSKEQTSIGNYRNDLNIRYHLQALDLDLLAHHIATTGKTAKQTIAHGKNVVTFRFTGKGVLIENISKT